MKIIDDKGKLFGIINIIDLGVALVAILLIAGAGLKFMGNPLKPSGNNVKTVTLTVACRLQPGSAETLLKGGNKRLVSGSDFVDGNVVDVKAVPARTDVKTADGRIVMADHPYLKDIYVTLKIKQNVSAPVMKLGPQEVRLGAPFIVKTQTVQLTGMIENLSIS